MIGGSKETFSALVRRDKAIIYSHSRDKMKHRWLLERESKHYILKPFRQIREKTNLRRVFPVNAKMVCVFCFWFCICSVVSVDIMFFLS